MKILLVDISGKVSNYDKALFNALQDEVKAQQSSVDLLLPGNGLLRLIPKCIANSESLAKRFGKVLEGLLNYFYLILLLSLKKVDVLHLQWLPFMEVTNWENVFLKIMHFVSPKTKIILTIHNIYPHNMSTERKVAYNKRFTNACKLIDGFIVHTQISKQDVIKEFNIPEEKVSVACHGVFEPKDVTLNDSYRKNGKLHILQFGGQSYYKGTDVLVDAVCGLDKSVRNKIETHIVGGISEKFLNELKEKDKDGVITWKPYFLNDKELYEEINNSDLIVLPYRAISQSGVLLLAIYFEKLIICSDLPSFVETMRGDEDDSLDENLFFKSEDAKSLSFLLEKYVESVIPIEELRGRIINLRYLYSWTNAAKETLKFYKIQSR